MYYYVYPGLVHGTKREGLHWCWVCGACQWSVPAILTCFYLKEAELTLDEILKQVLVPVLSSPFWGVTGDLTSGFMLLCSPTSPPTRGLMFWCCLESQPVKRKAHLIYYFISASYRYCNNHCLLLFRHDVPSGALFKFCSPVVFAKHAPWPLCHLYLSTQFCPSCLSTHYTCISPGPLSDHPGELVKIQMLGFRFRATVFLTIGPSYLHFNEFPGWL